MIHVYATLMHERMMYVSIRLSIRLSIILDTDACMYDAQMYDAYIVDLRPLTLMHIYV